MRTDGEGTRVLTPRCLFFNGLSLSGNKVHCGPETPGLARRGSGETPKPSSGCLTLVRRELLFRVLVKTQILPTKEVGIHSLVAQTTTTREGALSQQTINDANPASLGHGNETQVLSFEPRPRCRRPPNSTLPPRPMRMEPRSLISRSEGKAHEARHASPQPQNILHTENGHVPSPEQFEVLARVLSVLRNPGARDSRCRVGASMTAPRRLMRPPPSRLVGETQRPQGRRTDGPQEHKPR